MAARQGRGQRRAGGHRARHDARLGAGPAVLLCLRAHLPHQVLHSTQQRRGEDPAYAAAPRGAAGAGSHPLHAHLHRPARRILLPLPHQERSLRRGGRRLFAQWQALQRAQLSRHRDGKLYRRQWLHLARAPPGRAALGRAQGARLRADLRQPQGKVRPDHGARKPPGRDQRRGGGPPASGHAVCGAKRPRSHRR